MTNPADSDEALMQQVVMGERLPLHLLMQRHGSALLTFLYRFTSNMALAEDLFQDTFLAVWMHRDRYAAPRSFRAWLWGIAANRAREACRNREVRSRSLLRYTETALLVGEDVASIAARAEQALRVQWAVNQLPEQQRQVVVMRLWNDLPYAEIGQALTLAEGTVRSHMSHALAALRQALAKEQ